MFISQKTGLPVVSCDVTVNQLNRQARQSQKRLDLAAGKTNAEVRGIDENGMPRLVNPDRLFSNVGRTANAGNVQATQMPAVGSSGSSLPASGVDGADYSSAAEGTLGDGGAESP
jgi:hypothetical protein